MYAVKTLGAPVRLEDPIYSAQCRECAGWDADSIDNL